MDNQSNSLHINRAFISAHVPEVQWKGIDLDPSTLAWHVDSRQCTPGSVFVALAGAHRNGHDYIIDAVSAGARYLWVALDRLAAISAQLDKQPTHDPITVIASRDPLTDLVAVARAWRARLTAPVIGITGSVGKTTTKELLGKVIRAAGYRVYTSRGNQNTLLGCSLNILSMDAQAQFGIFEMGISRSGEMAAMTDLVRPTYGMITYIGHSHVQGLGSLEDIASQKRAIFAHFSPTQIGIVHGDQPVLVRYAYQHPVIRFGKKTTNHVQARKINISAQGITAVIKIYQEKHIVHIPSYTSAYMHNVLGVLTCAVALGIDHRIALDEIQKPCTIPGRFVVHRARHHQGIVVDDSYNASPESMREALMAFERIPHAHKKVAILGDMLELGMHAPFWHRQLGRLLNKAPSVHDVILVGTMVEEARKTLPAHVRVQRVATWQEALDLATPLWYEQAAILVKASRGIQLQHIVDALMQDVAPAAPRTARQELV